MGKEDILNQLKFHLACWQPFKLMPLKDTLLHGLKVFADIAENEPIKSTKNETQIFANVSEIEISDKDCWELIYNLGEKDGMLVLSPLLDKNIRKMKEALRNGDYAFFLDNIDEYALRILKILIVNWKVLKRSGEFIVDFYENILARRSDYFSVAKEYDFDKLNIFPLESYKKDQYRKEYRALLNKMILLYNKCLDDELSEEEEKELSEMTKKVFQKECVFLFEICNKSIFPYITQKAIFTVFEKSKYSENIQEFYNQYRKKNPDAEDWMICEKNYENVQIPKRTLPEDFDEKKKKAKEKNNLYLDLGKKDIQYLFRTLLDEEYISENTNPERFAFFLTGKPKDYKNLEPIGWLGQEQDLACFIGILYSKKGEGIRNGKWERTAETFIWKNRSKVTSNEVTDNKVSSKGLSTIYNRIAKKCESNKDYKNRSYNYFKELIKKIKKLS